jgi:dolichyl-phosphate beta-glucosyltransferase
MKNYKLSIVIPAYNEELRIENTILKINNKLKNILYEIIVVDDGSFDNTKQILNKMSKENANFKYISYDKNQGKGFALKTGFKEAQGDFVLMIDADLSSPIETIFELEKELENYDVIIGSRLLKSNKTIIHGPISRKILRKLTFLLRKILFDIEITDTQCGFKIFKNKIAKEISEKLTINRFGADLEKIIIASKLTNKIIEVPVSWEFEPNSSKIKIIKDSFRTIKEWIKIKNNIIKGIY